MASKSYETLLKYHICLSSMKFVLCFSSALGIISVSKFDRWERRRQRWVVSPTFFVKMWLISGSDLVYNELREVFKSTEIHHVSLCFINTDCWAGVHFYFIQTEKNLWKQSIIWHKKLSQTTTMSFLSEPVCLPPQLKHDFKGVKAFWEFHFQAEHRLSEGSSGTAISV